MRSALTRAGQLALRGLGAVCHPARGAVVELAWTTTHLATYSLGLLREPTDDGPNRFRPDPLPPAQRGLLIGDLQAAGTPILLVHGILDNRSVFTLLRRGLRRRGFGRIRTHGYHVLTRDVRLAAERLGEAVERLAVDTGYEQVHVIGHSLGGLIARYHVQRLGGDSRVHTLVTLGTPHAGTRMAHLLPARMGRQLRPGSELLAELALPAPGCRTRFLAVWSDMDEMIVPKRAARIVHPDLSTRNVFLRGAGHLSMPIDGRAIHEISSTLAQLDAGGGVPAAPDAAYSFSSGA